MILEMIFLLWLPIDGGYTTIPVWLSDNLEEDCDHMHGNGCVLDEGIILSNPHGYHHLGCTILTHEYYHKLQFRENEIPTCPVWTPRLG